MGLGVRRGWERRGDKTVGVVVCVWWLFDNGCWVWFGMVFRIGLSGNEIFALPSALLCRISCHIVASWMYLYH